MANIVLSIFTLLLAMKGSVSVNVLESNPPSVNGILTACAGQQISLTCSHNISVGITSVTVWRASPPIGCTSFAVHGSGDGRACGPFTLDNVTLVENAPPFPIFLHSTLAATAAVNMTGINIDCSSGSPVLSVGNISLCIVAPPPAPIGIMCQIAPMGLNVTWETVIDTSCAMSDVNYSVTAIRESERITDIDSFLVSETTVELTNTLGLQPNTSYMIYVSSVIINGGCTSQQQANVTCGTSPDLPTVATPSSPPTTPTTMSTTVVSSQSTPPPNTTQPPSTTTSTGLSTGVIAAIAVVVIVLVFLAIVIVIVVVIILMISSKDKKTGRGGVHAPLATDPEHDSLSGQQQQAPVYAMVDKSKKTSAEQPTYQDPATIQHETAESGDLYAVSEKKGKAAKADAAAELYSEVDKSNRSEGGLTYASIEVEAKKKPMQKETEVLYSDIQH